MNTQLSLVILAVELNSRYKVPTQLQVVGPQKELLIEYTIYDALTVGIRHFVFVINEEFDDAKRKLFKKILETNGAYVEFVLQTTYTSISRNYFDAIINRRKNWGTSHALLVAKNHLSNPFIVINYEGFYGREAFKKALVLMKNRQISANRFGAILYQLNQTIHDKKHVKRGVCVLDKSILQSIKVYKDLFKFEDKIIFEEENLAGTLDVETATSQSFWIFHPSIFKILEDKFEIFMKFYAREINARLELDTLIHYLIENKQVEIDSYLSSENAFQLYNLDDRDLIAEEIKRKIDLKKYPIRLWN